MKSSRPGTPASLLFFLLLLPATLLASPIPVRPLPARPAVRSAAPAAPLDASAVASVLRGRIAEQTGRAPVERRLESLRHTTANRLVTVRSTHYGSGAGAPRQVVLGAAAILSKGSTDGDADLTTVRETLRETRSVLGIDDPDRELALATRSVDALGLRHFRFTQSWRGIPVWPADVIVHLDRSGNPMLIDGSFARTPRRVPARAVVGESQARERAEKVLPDAGMKIDRCERIVFTRGERPSRLAWRITAGLGADRRWMVVVDALNGEVLTSFSLIETAAATGSGVDLTGVRRDLNLWQAPDGYYLIDTSKMMFDASSTPPAIAQTRGAIYVLDARNATTSEFPLYYVTSTSATNWVDPNAVSASYALSQTYDYYRDRHGRNSINGEGGTLKGVVRYKQNYDNAFWSSDAQTMYFGDADLYPGSIDVVAHEMTHGVTSSTAKLVYRGESGALNEAISDIFGEMVEARTFGTNDWLMGSQLHASIRSMSNPGLYGQPAKMSDYVQTEDDNGGVHTNSGIINRAYYLLAAGLPGAIGLRDSERIFYRALTTHLTSGSDFLDARLAAIQSARELFGDGSAQASRTAEAFDSVEIFESTPPPPPPSFPAVTGPDSTLFVYSDAGKTLLGRRETALGDPEQGVGLTERQAAENRPSVTGDGRVAFFVSSDHDGCFILTDGSKPEQCLGFPGVIGATAMSPDGVLYAFVFLDSAGDATNRISVINADTGASSEYSLDSPVFDGESLSSVLYADTMDFTADGQFLVYDALNEVTFGDGAILGAWSVYALELESGAIFPLVGPVEGADIEYPALSQTSDRFLAFDVQTPASSSILSVDLETGDMGGGTSTSGFIGVASYNGDDSALVYSVPSSTPTGYSVARLGLAADHITTTGSPTLWISDADYAVIYRRGTFQGPTEMAGSLAFSASSYVVNEGATVTVTVLRTGGNKGAVSVAYQVSGGSATAGTDFAPAAGTLIWQDGESDAKTFLVTALSDSIAEPTETISLVLTNPLGGATLGAPQSSVLNVTDRPAGGGPKRKRGIRRR